MKIAIAIPTYNRLDALKRAVAHIEKQEIDSSFELYCVICNTASTDGTHEYLSNLQSTKVKYVVHTSQENSVFVNWYKLTTIIPDEIDWIWFHGDDDYLSSSKSVIEISKIIKAEESKNFSFIHACQTRRSRNTKRIYKGSLLELCNQFGYLEMLGWMSSLVMKKDRWISAIQLSSYEQSKFKSVEQHIATKSSAFAHSHGILNYCHQDQAVFVDLGLIDPQNTEQTKESIQRWAVERAGERYFFVVDDLLKLKDKGILKDGVTKNFFRYLTYNLWDRYAVFIIEHLLLNKGMYPDLVDHFNRIKEISVLFQSSSDVKSYLLWWYSLENEIKNYQKTTELMNESVGSLERLKGISNVANYDFQVLGLGGVAQ